MIVQNLQNERLGAAMFSVGEMYTKLHCFKRHAGGMIYFAKVDVKGCFDSLPQREVMKMVRHLIQADDYSVNRYAQVRPSESAQQGEEAARPAKKYTSCAWRGRPDRSFSELLGVEGTLHKTNTVFIDGVVSQTVTRRQVLKLLEEHIEANVIKIGKKYFRQKQGIAQGSVVSSLICNLFYGELEAKHLGFLSPETSILFRLIDDFLLLTTDQQQATDFLAVMHRGMPAYGVTIKPEKSLANFDLSIGNFKVPRLAGTEQFPYCGVQINTRTLEVSRGAKTVTHGAIADSLTVDWSKTPGTTFRRKMLSGLKIQMHGMLFDTSHNSVTTVWRNVHTCMLEAARKALQYSKDLGPKRRPSIAVLERTVGELAALGFAMLKSRRQRGGGLDMRHKHHCTVSRAAVQWITAVAFLDATQARQSGFGDLLPWLRCYGDAAGARLKGRERRVRAVLSSWLRPDHVQSP